MNRLEQRLDALGAELEALDRAAVDAETRKRREALAWEYLGAGADLDLELMLADMEAEARGKRLRG